MTESIRPDADERARARAARRAHEEAMATHRMLGIAIILCALVGISFILAFVF